MHCMVKCSILRIVTVHALLNALHDITHYGLYDVMQYGMHCDEREVRIPNPQRMWASGRRIRTAGSVPGCFPQLTMTTSQASAGTMISTRTLKTPCTYPRTTRRSAVGSVQWDQSTYTATHQRRRLRRSAAECRLTSCGALKRAQRHRPQSCLALRVP